MNIQIRKLALRQSIIAAREKMPPQERLRANHAIVGTLCGLAGYRQSKTVLAYMNFGAELDAELFVRQALKDGKQVCLPKVSRETRELDIYHVGDLQRDVAPGARQIPEPLPHCAPLDDLAEIGMVLLPGVAFGRDGARLGYGGGFYDKLLARLPHHPPLVAGAFGLQVVKGIPQEAFDRKVEWLVTEHEIIACATMDNDFL